MKPSQEVIQSLIMKCEAQYTENVKTTNKSSKTSSTGGKFCDNKLSVATSSFIEVGSVFVSHLTSALAASILSALDEASIPIRSDDPVIEARSVDVAHRVLCVLAGVVLHEAEATRSALVLVQTHHNALDVTGAGKKFVDLLFRREKRQVSDVKCCGMFQYFFKLPPSALVLLVTISAEFDRCRKIASSLHDCHPSCLML